MDYWLNRTQNLIGADNLNKIQSANIAIIGIGGVGSFCVEGLIRAGVQNLTLIDNDNIDITNINRQIHADTTTVGKSKVQVMKERILKINPQANITIYQEFLDENNAKDLITANFNYVIDCIDNVKSKLCLIETCDSLNIPIISSMGTGNKLDPTKFEIANITKTSVCPLARIIRKELKKKNINNLKVLFSKEEPFKEKVDFNNKKTTPASISFVPSVAGLMIASQVVNDIINTHK